MATRVLFSFAMLAGLSACAPLSPYVDKVGKCNQKKCDAIVVTKAPDTLFGRCQVFVDPPTLEVARGNTDALIEWALDKESVQAGYALTDTPIVIKDFDPKREFRNPKHMGTRYTIENANTFPKKYKYSVFTKRGDQACKELDPWIINP